MTVNATPGNFETNSTARRTFGPTGLYARHTSVGARHGKHLRLGERRRLVFDDSFGEFDLRDGRHLVRLAVRPQPRRMTGDADHLVQILFQNLAKEDQRRAEYQPGVSDPITGIIELACAVGIHALTSAGLPTRLEGEGSFSGALKYFASKASSHGPVMRLTPTPAMAEIARLQMSGSTPSR